MAANEPGGRVEQAGPPADRTPPPAVSPVGPSRRRARRARTRPASSVLPFLRATTSTTDRQSSSASRQNRFCHGSSFSGWPSQRSSLWVSVSQNAAKWSTGFTSPAQSARRYKNRGRACGLAAHRLSRRGVSPPAPGVYLLLRSPARKNARGRGPRNLGPRPRSCIFRGTSIEVDTGGGWGLAPRGRGDSARPQACPGFVCSRTSAG